MKYEETHPWMTFRVELGCPFEPLWYHLGRACAGIRELLMLVAAPEVHRRLNQLYMVKGVVGSTAIEGNTLTEAEVEGMLERGEKLPPSKHYLEQEVRNVSDACDEIVRDTCSEQPPMLSLNYLCKLNAMVLRELNFDTEIIPGAVRTFSVMVGRYRGAPAEECEVLLDKLCEWLESDAFRASIPSMEYASTIIQAVTAHIYMAWIHPFGDGNGRTARLVEFFLLLRGGIPAPAAHLMSNFYNATRTRYYSELARLSSPVNGQFPPIGEFISYAVEGLADGLCEQLSLVAKHHLDVIWEHYVYSHFRERQNNRDMRRRDLLLNLSDGKSHQLKSLDSLSPHLYHFHYKSKTLRTLQRDLKALVNEGFLNESEAGYRIRTDALRFHIPEHRHPSQ